MIKFIFTITILLCFVITTEAKITIEQDTINCGKTIFRDSVSATFTMQYFGHKHLAITKIDPSCGCTLVEYPHTFIKNKKTFTITLTYDAMQLGHYSKWVDVYTTDSEEPLRLTIEGEIVSPRSSFIGRKRFVKKYEK